MGQSLNTNDRSPPPWPGLGPQAFKRKVPRPLETGSPLTSCRRLGKTFKFSESQFHTCEDGHSS